jgi:hypothetical protein
MSTLNRLCAASLILTLCASGALAQTSTSGTVKNNTGLATPPATLPQTPQKPKHDENSAIGANVPTTPQIALHPQPTIGTTTPLAGPGGNTSTGTGN